ncbi:hypothetical protein FGM00_06145 [Aggregatimonas sangjinii]|uniref:Peptidase M14 domain-containing protein n=1 Tax=Aggregatimonas sangjinii TaxID=2583587 RepID=A0A5B7SS74_9FLAO|nr:M14 family metallopeptidase [Aggregatimonas sangjinii]QCW99699.1 hypothetical protein FGM00_06145 [Aggregatimonas sangjinii]
MKKTLYFLLFLVFFNGFSQDKKFQGQAPITIVPTTSLPVQKQWKGEYTFENPDITFSNDFDGARLNGIVKNDDGSFTALITSENTPVNPSPWYAFKVWSKSPRTIEVMLTYQQGAKHRYFPKLSMDGLRWTPIDLTDYKEYEKGAADFGAGSLPVKVRLKLNVGQTPLWVAGQELQTLKHMKDWIDEISNKKFVNQQVIGKSTEGRDMHVMTIGKEKRKQMVMVISRQHPPEVTGFLAMKSFIETIASESRLAKKFRKKFTVHVVPLMNPDGVDNGHWRHSKGGIDLNRDWSNFNQPETRAVRDFMEDRVATTNGKFYFGIDFHSTWDDIYYTVDPKLKGNMPGLVTDWLTAVKKELPNYEPNIKPNDELIPTAVSRNYFFIAHGAEALVFEVGDNTPRDFLHEKAVVSANELMRLLLER